VNANANPPASSHSVKRRIEAEMSDSYQAVYDAVRSKISNANIGDAVAPAPH